MTGSEQLREALEPPTAGSGILPCLEVTSMPYVGSSITTRGAQHAEWDSGAACEVGRFSVSVGSGYVKSRALRDNTNPSTHIALYGDMSADVHLFTRTIPCFR